MIVKRVPGQQLCPLFCAHVCLLWQIWDGEELNSKLAGGQKTLSLLQPQKYMRCLYGGSKNYNYNSSIHGDTITLIKLYDL